MYFIIKPVKTIPSRFKKATKSIIKFNELRFMITPLSNTTYRNRLPGLGSGIFNCGSRIGVDSYLEPGGAGITLFVFVR